MSAALREWRLPLSRKLSHLAGMSGGAVRLLLRVDEAPMQE
jgi:hypothetical protein